MASPSSQPDPLDRRDIKSLSLCPTSLPSRRHRGQGVRGLAGRCAGNVTGVLDQRLIVKDSAVITYPKNNDILGGITRLSLLDLAQWTGVTLVERSFTLTGR
jgi:branched-subunit amino acid aminotransferase/4-amino-4-deoxychorismate lyase